MDLGSYTGLTEYTPEWRNNHESDKPLVVRHKQPSASLKRDLIKDPILKQITDEDGTRFEALIPMDYKKIVKGMVTGLSEPITYVYDGRSYDIKTADDFFKENVPPAIDGLVTELGGYFAKLLRESVDAKN